MFYILSAEEVRYTAVLLRLTADALTTHSSMFNNNNAVNYTYRNCNVMNFYTHVPVFVCTFMHRNKTYTDYRFYLVKLHRPAKKYQRLDWLLFPFHTIKPHIMHSSEIKNASLGLLSGNARLCRCEQSVTSKSATVRQQTQFVKVWGSTRQSLTSLNVRFHLKSERNRH